MSVIAQFISIHQVPLYKTINAVSRAKIIDDAFHFMMERQFNVSVFWNLTRYLSEDTDYVAWYPMIKIFEYMSILVSYSVEEIKYIDIKVMTNRYYLKRIVFISSTISQFQIVIYFQMKRFNYDSCYFILK